MSSSPLSEVPQAVPQQKEVEALPQQPRLDLALPVILASTSLFSAFLLLLLQPMVGKILLPLVGGAPAIWNTCLVFFQTTLLLGYLYSHLVTRKLPFAVHLALHAILLLLAFLALPIAPTAEALNGAVALAAHPELAVLKMLVIMVGLPFLAVSTTAPLLQQWLTFSDAKIARDPYVLYSASNLGSILAIALYPTLIEGNLKLPTQMNAWRIGFGVFALLTMLAAALVWRTRRNAATPSAAAASVGQRPSWRDRLWWVGLAFIPSSLLIGCTTYLTIDIASVPMLWMIPLSLYLISFILVFAEPDGRIRRLASLAFPLSVVALIALVEGAFHPSLFILLAVHLSALFVISVHCHGTLARRRPGAEHLTEFYFWMATGGALGGVFNALVAPHLFVKIAEYSLVAALAAFFVERPRQPKASAASDLSLDAALPLLLAGVTAFLVWLSDAQLWSTGGMSKALGLEPDTFHHLISFLLPLLLCLVFLRRPVRFGIAVTMVLLSMWAVSADDNTLYRERTFFGTLRVAATEDDGVHWLTNGSTLHGIQNLKDPVEREKPLSYYHRNGPVGDVLGDAAVLDRRREVAVVGLGTGSVAAYCSEGTHVTFFEIDVSVVEIASNVSYFTYLSDCERRGGSYDVVLGDARITMARETRKFDTILVDAFSSDSIPVHLLTAEGVKVFLAKLNEGGVLLFHISNRHLDLEPVLGNLAQHLELAALTRNDFARKPEEGRSSSSYVALARGIEDLERLVKAKTWTKTNVRRRVGVWTDDYSNVLKIFR